MIERHNCSRILNLIVNLRDGQNGRGTKFFFLTGTVTKIFLTGTGTKICF
jgi:hypothetical protein